MASFIFIGGVPRSGTSLIQKILDLHSQIYGGPEFDHLFEVVKLYERMMTGLANGRQKHYYSDGDLRHAFRTFINQVLATRVAGTGIHFLSEKTPLNVFAFPYLKDIFPDAKFIFVVRDPRANVSSFREVAKRAKEFGDTVNLGSDLLRDLQLIDRYVQLGNAFSISNRASCYTLYYEDLVCYPEPEVKRLCEFLGVPFEPGMLDLASKESDASKLINSGNKSVRAWSVPGMLEQVIDKQKVDAWKRQLSPRERAIIDEFFASRGYECLKRYSFRKPSLITCLYAAYPFGLRCWVKSLIRNVRDFF